MENHQTVKKLVVRAGPNINMKEERERSDFGREETVRREKRER